MAWTNESIKSKVTQPEPMDCSAPSAVQETIDTACSVLAESNKSETNAKRDKEAVDDDPLYVKKAARAEDKENSPNGMV